MNIKEAKQEIKNSMQAYFTKDKFGNYVIPLEHQRPIFLMGPPGIGKTEIMAQVAGELNVGLVSYSMTHHTRQSALGLPFIEKKVYGGQEYNVSEYTMSEIIASVYDMMEETGCKEGILFLDEINCVSETLAPSMLQFLQYKIFGRHRVPDGWIVVTAGNPPEYNKSVREFDTVTWDRLKRIDVEPDFDVWKEYAHKHGIHPAILTYLEVKRNDFYKVTTTVDGKRFVTARGWSDLSDMMCLYEQQGLPICETLVSQYLQDPQIAKEFAIYYDLFNKYRADYQVENILKGKQPAEILKRAQQARADERYSLLGLLLDAVNKYVQDIYYKQESMHRMREVLGHLRATMMRPGAEPLEKLTECEQSEEQKIAAGRKASSLSKDDEYIARTLIQSLQEIRKKMVEENISDGAAALKSMVAYYNAQKKVLEKMAEEAGKYLENMFKFSEEAFGEGTELLILVTELTNSYYSVYYISRYGCPEYFKHNKELKFYERQREIIRELDDLDLDS